MEVGPTWKKQVTAYMFFKAIAYPVPITGPVCFPDTIRRTASSGTLFPSAMMVSTTLEPNQESRGYVD